MSRLRIFSAGNSIKVRSLYGGTHGASRAADNHIAASQQPLIRRFSTSYKDDVWPPYNTIRFKANLPYRPLTEVVKFLLSKSSVLKIQKGDITLWSVDGISDAIVNPANEKMLGGGNADGGHFRPSKAADPGLVYDASYTDYLLYLCGNNMTMLDPSFKCPQNPSSPANLNYPSLAIPNLNGTVMVKKTVANVGSKRSVHFASVKSPEGVSVKISPSILYFKHISQKKSFTITLKMNRTDDSAGALEKGQYQFGWYNWNDAS